MNGGNSGKAREERYSAEKLLHVFSRTRFMSCLVLAVFAHIAVLGITSMTFIRDKYIDPEGAEERKRAAEAADKSMTKGSTLMEAGRAASSNVAAMVSAETNVAMKSEAFVYGTNTGEQASTTNNPFLRQVLEDMPKDGRAVDSRIIKEMTDLPATNEIPSEPDADLFLRIEDTNP